jgi:hypothetical protein
MGVPTKRETTVTNSKRGKQAVVTLCVPTVAAHSHYLPDGAATITADRPTDRTDHNNSGIWPAGPLLTTAHHIVFVTFSVRATPTLFTA